MMAAKRAHLDGIIQAIDETQKLMNDGECDWDSLVKVIQAIQMEQNRDWVNKYFTPEQLEEMKKLSEGSYSEEALQKMASRAGAWTEADQQRVGAQWAEVTQGITSLASANADPASPEAQNVAKLYSELIAGFTGGDPEIAKGLNRFWEQHESLPEGRKPLASPYSREQQEWLERALEVYKQKSK
jgi:hypothetical protein